MTRRVIALAVFLAVTFGLTIGIAAQIRGVSFTDRYQVSATFDDVTGLFVGDPVKLAGVNVGQVTKIKLDHGRADVRFAVDRSVKLPREGSVVRVRWRNLIGQRDLYLDPGPGAATATSFLATDGSATIANTVDAVDVGAVLGALGPLGRAVDPRQLNDIFSSLAQALDGNAGNIDGLVQNLAGVTHVIASRDQTIQQMLGDYQAVSDVLAHRDQQIQAMVGNIAVLSQAFTDNTQLVESAIDNLSGTATSVDALLTRNEQSLRGFIDNLHGVADLVTQQLPQLESAFGGLPAALQALFSIANGGNFLRVDAACVQVSAAPCNVLGGYSTP